MEAIGIGPLSATVLFDMPVLAGALRTVQWVTTSGLLRKTVRGNAATLASRRHTCLRGRPGRSSPCGPSSPSRSGCATN
jgi:hypothetical protein